MAVLEVPLFSGFRADIESLEQVRCCNESARHDLGPGPSSDWQGFPLGSNRKQMPLDVRALSKKTQLKLGGQEISLVKKYLSEMSKQIF